MKWTPGSTPGSTLGSTPWILLTALLAAAVAAPSSRQGPKSSTSVNMRQDGNSEPITIQTTQNIFGDSVSVTPPGAESIELKNDNTRFYPDYGDEHPVDNDHFPSPQGPTRFKRRSIDYNDLNYEMYLDSRYTRTRRDAEKPLRIDLNIPDAADSLPSDSSSSASSSDVQADRSSVSDPDSVSTQITYVFISDDDSSSDEAVQTVMEQMRTDPGEHTTEVIDLATPSSEQGTTNSDPSSTDSVAERNHISRAIAHTIRAKRSLNDRRRSSAADTDLSDAQLLTRKRRQIPYHRLPDFLNYRVGRSASEPDSDDTEPDDAQGLDLELLDGVARLPEYSYEFSELTRPSSTNLDGKLHSYYVPERQKNKRSLPSTERSELESTTQPALDIVTASYPLGIDATKDNLSLPEGNFLGPRIYAKGDLLQEEQPAATGIAAPMEKEESIPVGNGSEIDIVYSAPVNNVNLPLIIPVVGPTSHPGEDPRIELSVPSGYIPYVIQLSPTNQNATDATQHTSTSETTKTSSKPQVLSFVPTIIITPSTPTLSMSKISNQTNALPGLGELALGKSSEVGLESETSRWTEASSSLATTASLETVSATSQPNQDKSTSTVSEGGKQIAAKQKRAEWKTISSAPAGEVEERGEQTASWKSASNAPTSEIEIKRATSTWGSVLVGEEEIPKQQTAGWKSISNAPAGAVQVAPKEQTARWQLVSTAPTVEEGLPKQTTKWESTSTASAGDVELPKQSRSWNAVPVGEEELPKQQISRWELISSAPAGEVHTSTTQTENRGVSSESPTTSGHVSFASSSPESSSEPFESSSPASEISSGSEMSDQAAPIEGKRRKAAKWIIPILEKSSAMSPNGSFSYSFKSGNGIQVEESGYLKKETVREGSSDSGGIGVAVQGSYSYTAPDGRLISVRYVADEKGFRPEVEDLPK